MADGEMARAVAITRACVGGGGGSDQGCKSWIKSLDRSFVSSRRCYMLDVVMSCTMQCE